MCNAEAPPLPKPHAVVVVLGDIGRSPRMCNHARSLSAQLNYTVDLLGYLDTVPPTWLCKDPNVRFVPLRPPPELPYFIPEPIALGLKLLWTATVLLFALMFRIPFYFHLLLVQNPPGLPTLAICYIISRLKKPLWVIDWHNYTYSMLQHKWAIDHFDASRYVPHPEEAKSETSESAVPRRRVSRDEREAVNRTKKKTAKAEKKSRKSLRRIFVEWVYSYEGWFGRRAFASLCVSKAMRDDLLGAWDVPAAVFYDRPPTFKFGEVPLEEQHSLFIRLAEDGLVAFAGKQADPTWQEYTAFTYRNADGNVMRRDDRPLLLISSTSWTPDEDFEILLSALLKYDKNTIYATGCPHIICAVTGKGEEKEAYIEKIKRLSLSRVQIVTPWLEASDYPKILAASDLGVSLHTSTSGLDLPMKVVDMLGTVTPVLAKKYACIHELVVEDVNGKTFDTASELCTQLQTLSSGFPENKQLQQLTRNITEDPLDSWEEIWASVCAVICAPERNEPLERVLARE